MEHVDSSVKSVEQVESSDSSDMCEDELIIQRPELVRGNLLQRVEKEVRDNVVTGKLREKKTCFA